MTPMSRVLVGIAVLTFVGSFAWAISIDVKHLPVRCPRGTTCDPPADEATGPQNGVRLAIVTGGLTMTLFIAFLAERSLRGSS